MYGIDLKNVKPPKRKEGKPGKRFFYMAVGTDKRFELQLAEVQKLSKDFDTTHEGHQWSFVVYDLNDMEWAMLKMNLRRIRQGDTEDDNAENPT